jgi:hypothetical protein
MYGRQADNAVSRTLSAGVRVVPIPDGGRKGQLLVAELEDKLNPGGAVPARPEYRLNVTLTSGASPIGVAPDGTISRYNVFMASAYTLFRIADGKKLTSGSIDHVSSYNNVTNAYFSTYVSEQDAIKRGVTELAEIYRQRLAAHLTNPHPPKASDAMGKAPISLIPDPSLEMRYR